MSFVYLLEPGTKVQKDGGIYSIRRGGQILLDVPSNRIDGIVATEHVQMTSELMMDLMRKNISVHWISSNGESIGQLSSLRQINITRQIKQVELRKSVFADRMQCKVIEAKIHNQMTLLKHYNRTRNDMKIQEFINKMGKIIKCHRTSIDSTQRLGYEGISSKYYFKSMGMLVDKNFFFDKRSRRPPKDPFNALLSFGYTLLFHEVQLAVSQQGLHPYIGFLHQIREHHPALASDMMEEWRAVLIDSLVLDMVNRHRISLDDFLKNGQGIYLSEKARKKFIIAYEKKIQSISRNGHTYRHLLEMQAVSYAEAVHKEDASCYQPFRWR